MLLRNIFSVAIIWMGIGLLLSVNVVCLDSQEFTRYSMLAKDLGRLVSPLVTQQTHFQLQLNNLLTPEEEKNILQIFRSSLEEDFQVRGLSRTLSFSFKPPTQKLEKEQDWLKVFVFSQLTSISFVVQEREEGSKKISALVQVNQCPFIFPVFLVDTIVILRGYGLRTCTTFEHIFRSQLQSLIFGIRCLDNQRKFTVIRSKIPPRLIARVQETILIRKFPGTN